MSKISKIFGILYLLGNFIFFAAFLVLIFSTSENYQIFSSAWPYLLVLLLGMLSGYWICRAKYGWKRGLIIILSLICTTIALLITFVVGPQLEHLQAEKHKKMSVVQTVQLDQDVERLFLSVYSGELAIVAEQLAKGVDVNAVNETRQTTLHVTQNVDIAQLLIERGANIHAKDDTGTTPIFNKEIEIAEILLDAGIDIDSRDEKGNTLLIWYTYSGYLEGIKSLVKRGIDINACNTDRQNSLDIAEHFQPNTETMRYLQTLNIQPCAE